MNKTILFLTMLSGVFLSVAQQTYVPDDNFENYLETHDANGNVLPVGDPMSMGNGVANDDYVITANINTVTNLNINNQNITDITGIEDFTALQTLNCRYNQLTSLDLSQNTALQYLYCNNNLLTSLDLSQNMSLLYLDCFQNQLTGLILGHNSVLTFIQCFDNQINNLDLSQCTALQHLQCGGNQLTNLDVSLNANLEHLECYNNLLSSLDVSQNGLLNYLICAGNQILSLDLSQNHMLTSFNGSNNRLVYLNIQNGNNTAMDGNNFNDFMAVNNPQLSCIFVDDAAWSTANWIYVDATATFVETQADCDALSITDSFLNSFDIFPNPAKDILNIKSEYSGHLTLYSLTGTQIKHQNLSTGNNQLDTKLLKSGIYFIKIQVKSKVANFKIIKK